MISICVKCNNLNILKSLKTKLLDGNLDNLIVKDKKFKTYHNLIIHYTSKSPENFYYHFCNSLSDIIVNFFELSLVKRILSLNYFYFSKEDLNIIIDEFNLLKSKRIYNNSYIKSILFSSIYDYIIQNKVLVISGFVNFRLSSYLNYLETIISEAINQYIIDREYISFVNLLKSYVDSKTPNNLTLNLIYINSKGLLLSENGNLVKLEHFSNAYLSDISFSQNDYVLNTLIGLLPSKILIHLISPKDQFIKTIEMIFNSKVYYCIDCELCKAYKTLKLD